MNNKSSTIIIIGDIKREFIITNEKKAINNRLGGSAIASASGAGLWEQNSIILSTMNNDFPIELFDSIKNSTINIDHITTSNHTIEQRSFSFFKSSHHVIHNNPAKYYLDHNLEFPKDLLGISQNYIEEPRIVYPEINIPNNSHTISAAYLCPLSYEDHIRIPFILREKGIPTILLKPHPNYINKISLGKIPQLINNLTAFIPSKEDLFTLYPLLGFDIWTILAQFENQGCKFIVVPNAEEDTLLYDLESRRKYQIPPYPIRIKNLNYFEHAFGGGFTAGYEQTYDPIEAVLFGLISASFAMSGYTATYPLDALPTLAQARLNILREEVKII